MNEQERQAAFERWWKTRVGPEHSLFCAPPISADEHDRAVKALNDMQHEWTRAQATFDRQLSPYDRQLLKQLRIGI